MSLMAVVVVVVAAAAAPRTAVEREGRYWE
jgi:hypothetical protein